MSTTKLVSAVEEYLTDLRKIRASGGGMGERSLPSPDQPPERSWEHTQTKGILYQ